MTTPDLTSPWLLLSALPWVVLFAWVAARLLGARRLSRRRIAVAGVAGYAGGLTVTLVVSGTGASEAAAAWAGTALAIVFTMVAVIGLELLADRPVPSAGALPTPGVPHPVRAVRRRWAEARRFLEISGILARLGLGHLVGMRRVRTPTDRAEEVARRVRDALEEAGGISIKLGQLLATRVDLIPPSAAAEFAGLQEQAPAVPAEAIRQALESELGCRVEDAFGSFTWPPLAAASIAQVHRATLHDGTAVVVKVRRPGIVEVVQRDLAIVRRLVRRLERRTEWGHAHGIAGLADDFAAGLSEELDLRREARNVDAVRLALADLPDVRVPQVHPDLSTDAVLVMDELVGTTIASLEAAGATGGTVDRHKAAQRLLEAELTPMLAGQPFHADPHPGNVFLLADGGLGIIDLGAVGRLDAFERGSITGLVTALRDEDPTGLREAIAQVATLPTGVDVVALDRALARFMATHLSSGRAPDAQMLTDLARLLGDHHIRLPQATTTMFRALVTLEGTLQVLDPEFALLEAAEDLGAGLLRARLDPEQVRAAARDELVRVAPMLHRIPRHLDRIATLVERGELRTQVSLFATDRDGELINRLANRLLLGFAGATLGIVSAILLGLHAGPVVSGETTLLDVLGYVGLFAGVVLLLRVVLAAIRESG